MGVKDVDLRVEPVTASVRARLVDAIRKAILDFRLKPGDRLIERELCEQSGVSRTSVREALRQLESEGFITNLPNKGPVVATVTTREAKDIYELRAVLEGLAARKCALQATDGEIAGLRKAIDAFRKAVKSKDPRALIAGKTLFYDLLMAGARNDALEAALRNLHGRVTLLRATSMSQPGRVDSSAAELETIVDAIARRDAAAAERASRRHVERAAVIALAILATPPVKGAIA
jgi:DNA-binding GntR family transcriptional regulator